MDNSASSCFSYTHSLSSAFYLPDIALSSEFRVQREAMAQQQPDTIQSWEDRGYFIAFRDAPADRPRRNIEFKTHSCLLGEIIQSDIYVGLRRLVCEDIKKQKFIEEKTKQNNNAQKSTAQPLAPEKRKWVGI